MILGAFFVIIINSGGGIMERKSVFNRSKKKFTCDDFYLALNNLLCNFSMKGYHGYEGINRYFKYSSVSRGYSSIEDMMHRNTSLKTSDSEDWYFTDKDDVFCYIEIIVSTILHYESEVRLGKSGYVSDLARKSNSLSVLDLCSEYLTQHGMKFFFEDEYASIVSSKVALNINEIENNKVRKSILSYFHYSTLEDIEEKRKELKYIDTFLDGQKTENVITNSLLGRNTSERYSFFMNNFQIRHDNTIVGGKHFFEKFTQMGKKEIIDLYDFIYSYAVGIYVFLEKAGVLK